MAKKFIPVCEPDISQNEISLVNKAVKSSWVSSIGPYLTEFEKKFADYCDRKYSQAVANGTVALHLAMLALNIGKNDEVLVPNFTFIATANAVSYTGAKPIFIDIEKDTLNIDPEKIEEKITPRTKAIVVVHIYGHACDMDKILKIAKRHNLRVIEDAAEAHGTLYKGKRCGSFGDVSCFSFFGNKLITTGEGGMCLTNDKKLYEKIKLLKGQGMKEGRRYWHDVIGYNYRLTNIQAALGCAQLERIDLFLENKRANADLYRKLLGGIKGITLPVEKDYTTSNYWMFTIVLDKKFNRDKIAKKLKDVGIDTRVAFYPMSDLPPYSKSMGAKDSTLAVSHDLAYRALTLPSSSKLRQKDIVRICSELKRLL